MEQVPQGPVVGNPNPPQEEKVVLAVRKHLFGLILLYVEAIFGLSAGFLLILLLLPSLVGNNHTKAYGWASLIGLFLVTIVGVVLIIATIIYRRSQLVLTTSNITQVTQVGLFNRKISQLSLADIEDVSAEQKGIFPSIFKYGTVFIETAGEQANFHFDFCPNPNLVAKDISVCEQSFNNSGNQPH